MESGPEFQSYDAALDETDSTFQRKAESVFVIDEYPYLAKAKLLFLQCCSILLTISGQSPRCT